MPVPVFLQCQDGVCCQIITFEANLGGYHVAVFRLALVVIAFLSIVGLLLFMRPRKNSNHRTLGLYFNFVLFTALTFLIVVVVNLIPLQEDGGSIIAVIINIVEILSIAMQWIVQIAVVIFMFQKDTGRWSILLTMFITLALVLPMCGAFILAYFLNCGFCGQLTGEIVLIVFFASVLVLPALCECLPIPSPRPAAFWWCVFGLIAHLAFAFDALVLSSKIVGYSHTLTEIGACTTFMADLTYYVLYAVVLLITIERDSRYWRKKGYLRMASADAYSSKLIVPGLVPPSYAAMEGRQSMAESLEEPFKIGGSSIQADPTPEPPTSNNNVGGGRAASIYLPLIPSSDLKRLERLGEGGASEVFRGLWRGSMVAIKQFKISGLEYDDAKEDLIHEGRLMAELRHPNILLLLGLCVERHNLCMVTEFMQRGSLWDVLLNARQIRLKSERRRNRAVDRLAGILSTTQLARRVSSDRDLSTANVDMDTSLVGEDKDGSDGGDDSHIMRDHDDGGDDGGVEGALAPSNSLPVHPERSLSSSLGAPSSSWDSPPPLRYALRPSLMLRVLRGIASGMDFLHTFDPPIIHRDLKSHNLLLASDWSVKVGDFGISRLKAHTTTMTRVGTPQWMAPEVLREERYTELADVYSFGVVLWEMLTGRAPFDGVSAIRVVYLVASRGKRLPMPPMCPPKLLSLLQRCLEEDATRRPSFREIRDRLDDLTETDFGSAYAEPHIDGDSSLSREVDDGIAGTSIDDDRWAW